MDDIEPEKVRWLWKPYIPLGKVTILQGDPGLGKTFIATQLAAIVTNGETTPFCEDAKKTKAGNVIFQTAEDGLGDTIRVRLDEAEADCKRVFFIDEGDRALTLDDHRLKKAIQIRRPKLVIIDPLQAYLGAGTDMHRANEIRPLMTKLSNIATECGCAILLIGHQTKAKSNNAIYRGLGSIDIAAAARSVLVVCKAPEIEYRRAIVPIKSSLAPTGQTILFDLDHDRGFEWVGFSSLTQDDLLNSRSGESVGKKESTLDDCAEFLKSKLSQGRLPAKELKQAALKAGFSEATINRARKKAPIRGIKKGKGGWYCELKEYQDKLDNNLDILDNLDTLE